jgi:DNA mismatch repair protein MutS
MENYNFFEVEEKWKNYFLENKIFKTQNLKGFGIEDMPLGLIAAGVCLYYLSETHHDQVEHIQAISRISEEKYVWLDRFTIRNLELLYSSADQGVSLLQLQTHPTLPQSFPMSGPSANLLRLDDRSTISTTRRG